MVVREEKGAQREGGFLGCQRRGATLVVTQSKDTAAGDLPVGPALG